MALPRPKRPKGAQTSLNQQLLSEHLPPPANVVKTVNGNFENEQKEQKVENVNNERMDYPIMFDTKYNTNCINWNELHYLKNIKGKILFVKNLIDTNYSEYLSDYNNNTQNVKSLPKIPNLSKKILKFIHNTINECSIVQSAQQLLHSHNDWTCQVDNYEDISVYYRKEEGHGVHSIKTRMICKCHPINLIAVINEFQLMPETVTIVPMECRYLKKFTNMNKVIYQKINMFWPLPNRDCVAHVRAYDLSEESDEILIWGKSYDEIDGVDIPKCDAKTKRMECIMAEGVIRPILKKKTEGNDGENDEFLTEVISVFCIDFKSFLPQAIVNWVTRHFAFYACKMIRDRTENLEGTKHEEMIKEKQIYADWKATIKTWADKKFDAEITQTVN